jgi:hypothetical protein
MKQAELTAAKTERFCAKFRAEHPGEALPERCDKEDAPTDRRPWFLLVAVGLGLLVAWLYWINRKVPRARR